VPCSFKSYIDTVFGEKMNLLVEVVGAAACSGSPLDLHDLMYRFTLDSFGQIGFGVDPGCLKTRGKVAFAAAFDSAQVVSGARGGGRGDTAYGSPRGLLDWACGWVDGVGCGGCR